MNKANLHTALLAIAGVAAAISLAAAQAPTGPADVRSTPGAGAPPPTASVPASSDPAPNPRSQAAAFTHPEGAANALRSLLPAEARAINGVQPAANPDSDIPVTGVRFGSLPGGGTSPSPTPTTLPSGLTAPLPQSDLEAALASRTGPPLPDAQLGSHSGEAAAEAELRRRDALLTLRGTVNQKLLDNITQEQAIRIALAKAALPVVLPSDGNTGAPAGTGPLAGKPGEGDTAGVVNTADQPQPVPVVFEIGGLGRDLTAQVLVPYAGERQIRRGSLLPQGLTVVEIDPFAVIVEGPDHIRKALPMGRSVPATPPDNKQLVISATTPTPPGLPGAPGAPTGTGWVGR